MQYLARFARLAVTPLAIAFVLPALTAFAAPQNPGCDTRSPSISLDDEFGAVNPVIRVPRPGYEPVPARVFMALEVPDVVSVLPSAPRNLWQLGRHAMPHVDWIARTPWDDNYRPPLATLRASVPAGSAKYGPSRWGDVTPTPVVPLPEPDPDPDPDPVPFDGPSISWPFSDEGTYALIFRQTTISGSGIDSAYEFEFDNETEFAIAIVEDEYDAAFIEIAYFTADTIVTYDPTKDFSSGPKVSTPGTLGNLRVAYTFFPDEPMLEDAQGLFISVGGGWLEEHIDSNTTADFEKSDFTGGLQMYVAFGYMLPLGGPALELRAGFDMTLISENFIHTWFTMGVWF